MNKNSGYTILALTLFMTACSTSGLPTQNEAKQDKTTLQPTALPQATPPKISTPDLPKLPAELANFFVPDEIGGSSILAGQYQINAGTASGQWNTAELLYDFPTVQRSYQLNYESLKSDQPVFGLLLIYRNQKWEKVEWQVDPSSRYRSYSGRIDVPDKTQLVILGFFSQNPTPFKAQLSIAAPTSENTPSQSTPQQIKIPEFLHISNHEGSNTVYAVFQDGSQIQAFSELENAQAPRLSPDRTKIVYVSQGKIMVYSIKDKTNSILGKGKEPAWSPDGSEIVYIDQVLDSFDNQWYDQLFVRKVADDSPPQQITDDVASIFHHPSWSKSGIVVSIQKQMHEPYFLWTMDATGNQRKQIDKTGRSYNATWSPDGTKIAFAADRIGSRQIYLINADGNGEETPVSNANRDFPAQAIIGRSSTLPQWSPDGQKIVFTSPVNYQGKSGKELLIVNPDGTNQEQLTTIYYNPVQKPDTPTELSARIIGDYGNYSADLSWKLDINAKYYEIYRNGIKIQNVERGRPFTDSNLSEPSYKYQVKACNDKDVCSDLSSSYTAIGPAKAETTPDSQLTPAPINTIVYMGPGLNGQTTINRINPDGTQKLQLSSGKSDTHPAWSPDKKRIVFTSLRDGIWDVYLINADGSSKSPQRLTSSKYGTHQARFIDNETIVYMQIRDEGGQSHHEFFTMKVDGSNKQQISNINDKIFSHFDYCPNTQEFVMVGNPLGSNKRHIYTMNKTSKQLNEIFDGRYYVQAPSFSPDGQKILFYGDSDKDNQLEIIQSQKDGSGLNVMTKSNTFSDAYPNWSPDGSQIVFGRAINGDSDLHIMDSNGQNQRRIFTATGYDGRADW